MKKMLSLAALGMAALGTTLWAQQDDDPPPAQAPAASISTDERSQPGGLADAAASAGTLPSLSTTNSIGSLPAQPGSARASSPGNRSTGSGRSVGGPARPARPDLDMLPNSGTGPYDPAQSGFGIQTTRPGYPQPYSTPRYPANGGAVYVDPNGPQVVRPLSGQYYRPMSEEEQQSALEFRQTVEALRKAKTDEEKTDIRAKLNDLVSKQIDQDLTEREKRLTELEAKAKQLREQLQQRKQSKADIQKMLVMLIENPQGGLGLPPAWMDTINYYSQPQTYYPQSLPNFPVNAQNPYEAR